MKALGQNASDVVVSDFDYSFKTSSIYRGANKIDYYFFSDIKKAAEICRVIADNNLIFTDRYQGRNVRGNNYFSASTLLVDCKAFSHN
jgi:hypothetical protein